MFKKTCYKIKAKEEEEASLRLNLFKQDFLPSQSQHTKVKEGIANNVNGQQVLSNIISINNVQLKDESYVGDPCSNIMHRFVPSDYDNYNQNSLSTLKSFRDSRSKERGHLKEGLLSKNVLNPIYGNVRKRKYIVEKNTGNEKRPKVFVKAAKKESWIVNKSKERKTMRVCQKKIAESSGMTLGPETLKAHKEPRESYTIAPGPETQEITIRSGAYVTHGETLNGNMIMLQENEVSSVRVFNGKSFDFRCIICKKLPRKLNKSELYRHYATQHFYRELKKEFGHLKVCPYCNIELKLKDRIASHFGQKHFFVENYLPTKAWITTGWNRTSGRRIWKKIQVKERLRNEKTVWPEVPTGFDIDGPVNTRRCLDNQSRGLTNVGGFEIEVRKEILADQVKGGERLAIDKNEVVECRICKNVFEEEQATVMHLQVRHGISVSGDVSRDITAFLTTGYITIKGRSSVLSYSGEVKTASDNDAQSLGVIFDYESLF